MRLERAVERLARHPFHPGVAVSVHGPGGERHLAAGGLTVDSPCFFASSTKLMVATVLHQLAAEGLDLDAPLVSVVPMTGLLRLDGQDRTGEITIRQLMSHTSGLPDYLGSASPRQGLMGRCCGARTGAGAGTRRWRWRGRCGRWAGRGRCGGRSIRTPTISCWTR